MDNAKYLRDRAAEFANRAAATGDAFEAQNLHELSIICRESAERLDRRTKAKQPYEMG
ncbi:MAG TPA: hypothetical protein VN668_17960 [Stellaceae bacterium]|nr:hypothetical protein [Stellaceae bacterium]